MKLLLKISVAILLLIPFIGCSNQNEPNEPKVCIGFNFANGNVIPCYEIASENSNYCEKHK